MAAPQPSKISRPDNVAKSLQIQVNEASDSDTDDSMNDKSSISERQRAVPAQYEELTHDELVHKLCRLEQENEHLKNYLSEQRQNWEAQVAKISRVNERLESQLVHYKTIYAQSVYGLTDEEIAKYREAFELFDRENDGRIDRNEIAAAIEACGFKPTDEWIQSLIQEADRENAGFIGWPEFLKTMTGFIEADRVQETHATMVIKLREELSGEKEKIMTQQKQLMDAKEQISDLNCRYENQKQNTKASFQGDEAGHLSREVKKRDAMIHDLRAQFALTVARYKNQISEFQAKDCETKKKLTYDETAIDALEAQGRKLEHSIESLKSEIRLRLQYYTSQFVRKDDTIHTLTTQLKDLSEANETIDSVRSERMEVQLRTIALLEGLIDQYKRLYVEKTHGLTEEDIDKCWQVFNSYDKERQGHIARENVVDVVNAVWSCPDDALLQKLMLKIDDDGSNTIEWADFLKVTTSLSNDVEGNEAS